MTPNHAIVAHQFDDLAQQRTAGRFGMWLFLATEVLIFGALFTGYAAYRSLHSHEFEAASGRLNVLIGGINTVVLLTSSLTMALSVRSAQLGRQRSLVWCLALTALLGTAFMVFKGIEYYTDYRDQLVPNLAFDPAEWTSRQPPADPRYVQLFLVFYYVMTGLHAVHLTVGIGLMIWLIALAARSRFGPDTYAPVEVSGLYWHFVDVVWIFLLPLLYLIGTQSIDHLHF